MVKTAKLRLSSMAMSKSKLAIENILDKEDKRLFESDDTIDQDYTLPKKNPFRNFKYGKNDKKG